MTDPFVLLGGRDGALLVVSDRSDFADSFAARVGPDLIAFTTYDAAPDPLLHGLDILQHVPTRAEEVWRLDEVASEGPGALTLFRNREWAVDGRSPWLVSAASGRRSVVRHAHPVFASDIPVLPRFGYALAARVALLQGQGELRLKFLDQQGSVVAERHVRLGEQHRGGADVDDYQLATVRLAAPEDAVSAQIEASVIAPREESAAGGRGLLLLLDCALTAAPDQPRRWQPAAAAVPELVLAATGRGGQEFFAAPIELGAGTKEPAAEVVALDGGVPVATWTPGGGRVRASIREAAPGGLSLSIAGDAEPVALYVDGQFAVTTPARTGAEALGDRDVLLPIPEGWADGVQHVLEVRDLSGCRLIARAARILPSIQTPWQVVQQKSTAPLPYERAPAGTYRYVSLRRQLARLEERQASDASAGDDLAALAQVSRAHTALEVGFENNTDFSPLTFPTVERPTVSVIVPVHNKFAVTYHCLAALLLAPNDVDFEVVVVDDGSSDETLELGQIARGITLVRHQEAEGFVGACTSGAASARGEFLVLLNNDTEPTAGWLDELVAGFDRFGDVGMTGARLLSPNGRVQDAGGLVWETGNPANYGRRFSPADPRVSYARQVDYLSGAALMIRRSVWDEVGGLSQEYAPAYFEDTDLSFKVRAAGYTTWLLPSANVFHVEGVSNGTDVSTTTGLKRFQEINRPKFQAKWADAFVGLGEQGKNADLQKDRGIRGRVLFVDRGIPRPDRDAGSYAAITEMRLVQALGYKVTFLPLNLMHLGRHNDELTRQGIEVVHAPFVHSVADFLQRRGKEFDAVYVTRYNIAEQVLSEVRKHAPRAKVLFCNADLHFLRMMRAAQVNGDAKGVAEAAEVREAELEVMRQVDVVLSYNTVEHDIIADNGVSTPVVTCPWVVETAPAEAVPDHASRHGVAFLGGYQHPPNVQAVEFFVREVLPGLRDEIPDLHFNIYGSAMPESFLELADEVVHPIGYVRTVEEVYDSNRLFVAPLLSGAGIKGKVLGAMAQGIPSVISPVAAEGTGVVDGEDCVVAESVDDWVKTIAALYDDAGRWQQLSRSGREFTARHYSFDRGRDLMRTALLTAGLEVPPA